MLEVIDLISHVRNLEGTFPKREQRVANFMLANLEKISFLSQHEIAEATEGFCRDGKSLLYDNRLRRIPRLSNQTCAKRSGQFAVP